MENATKALIIAGAVLISILLISVGIMVFNAANDPLNQARNSSEQQAIQMFNESFSSYLGENKSAQEARSLISTVIASNQKNEQKVTVKLDSEVIVKGESGETEETEGGSGSATTGILSKIKTNKKYNITDSGYSDKGYINEITIK